MAAPGPDDQPSAPGALAGLEDWYGRNGRHNLPWRLTRDPYAVLVSEVMLQQTQVSRVLPAYDRWLRRWPGAPALAAASPADVIKAWSGLGYNRRALNLHRAAQAVVARHEGRVPTAVSALRDLPGIGAYTAAAVASFAGEVPVPVVDTNVGRVLARVLLGAPLAKDAGARPVAERAKVLLPAAGPSARHHNLALMDLGAVVCASRAPRCAQCPLSAVCAWRLAGAPAPAAVRPPAARFEATSRFARGRIVDHLRAGPLDERSLEDALPPPHAARLPVYLAALERDGLVARAGGGCWALPEAQGNSSIASPNE